MGCEAAATLRPRCDPRIRARRLMPGPHPSRRFGQSGRSIAQNRAVILNAMPCSGADPGSLAGSVRVASSPSASRQAEPIVAPDIGEADVQLRRRGEPVAERPESVAELHLEAPPLEAVIVGRELRKRRPPELRKQCSPGPS